MYHRNGEHNGKATWRKGRLHILWRIQGLGDPVYGWFIDPRSWVICQPVSDVDFSVPMLPIYYAKTSSTSVPPIESHHWRQTHLGRKPMPKITFLKNSQTKSNESDAETSQEALRVRLIQTSLDCLQRNYHVLNLGVSSSSI